MTKAALSCHQQSLAVIETAPELMNEAARKLGTLGGKAGTGASKRRDKAHYARISMLGVAARKQARIEKNRAEGLGVNDARNSKARGDATAANANPKGKTAGSRRSDTSNSSRAISAATVREVRQRQGIGSPRRLRKAPNSDMALHKTSHGKAFRTRMGSLPKRKKRKQA